MSSANLALVIVALSVVALNVVLDRVGASIATFFARHHRRAPRLLGR